MSTVSAGRSWLRIALRRIADEPSLVGAAFLVALIAATVASACVIYPETMARRGLIEVLRAADPASSPVVVTVDATAATADEIDEAVVGTVRAALGPADGQLVRTARSTSWQLPGGEGLAYPPLTTFAWDDGLEARATLVEGAWPSDGSGDRVEVVLTAGAARALGLAAGSALEVTSRRDPGLRLPVVVSGVVSVTDPADPAWGGDRLAIDGAAQPGSFPLRGPLYVSREDLLARASDGGLTLGWRALPAFEGIDPGDVGAIRGAIAGLEARIERAIGTDRPVSVSTGLVEILDEAGAGIAAGRGGVAIVALQLLVLAAYALVLIASLVADRRRAATDLAAARGAPASTVVGLAALEGAIMAVPAVVLGPPLAILLVGLLAGDDPGTLAAGGAGTPGPRLTGDAIALAIATGIVVVAATALPAVTGIGPVTRLRGRLAGRRSRGLGERTGVDLALVALAALGLWQLRENGTLLAGAGGGGAAVDPLLAAAPAIGLLAGGILALRLGPLVGAWLERPATSAAGAVAALAGRGVARRSADAGRAALLLVVATGFVLFTAAYGRTWTASQGAQVAAAQPAELVGTAPTGPAAPPVWALRAALLALPGVGDAVPASREALSVGTALPRGLLLAAPAEATARFVEAGRDPDGRPLGELVASLAAGRPTVPVVAVPDGTTMLALTIDADLAAAAADDGGAVRQIPAGWLGLSPSVVVRDGAGILHRFSGAAGRIAGGRQVLEIPLPAAGDGQPVGPEPPLDIVGVELELALPEGVAADGVVRLDGITARAAANGDDPVATRLDLGPAAAGWTAARSAFGVPPEPIAGDPADPLAARVEEPLVGPSPAVIALRASAAAAEGVLPAIVDQDVAAALGLVPGDVVPVVRGSSDIARVRVEHVVDVLPGTAPGTPGILVDLPTLALGDYLAAGTLPTVTEWWAGPLPGAAGAGLGAVADDAAAAGLGDVRVRSALLAARLADPLARGMLGALELAALAALAIAGVGFLVAAWQSVRGRRVELAVARAVGLGRGQSAAWLALELAFQLALGIGGGIVLGVVLAWAVLPSVTVTPDGSAPVPPPTVVVPWDLVVVAVGVGVAAFLALLVPLRGREREVDLAAVLREAQP